MIRSNAARQILSIGSIAAVIGLGSAAVVYALHRYWSKRRDALTASRGALKFHIVDVFTTGKPNSGNQLLVVEDRDEMLSDASMQAISAEIGFAESAFVRSGAKVKIYTVDEEVPQAGHPVIGLSEIVGGPCQAAGKRLTLLTKKGPIEVTSGDEACCWFASQDPPEWRGELPRSRVASVVLRSSADIVGDAFPIGSTCGLYYALVPLASEAALDDLAVNPNAPPLIDSRAGLVDKECWLYFYIRTGSKAVRTRMFCHEAGSWVEDVATGSAAGPLACHLAPIDAAFTQGSSRRAIIHVRSTRRESERVVVGGSVVRVAEGWWRLPSAAGSGA